MLKSECGAIPTRRDNDGPRSPTPLSSVFSGVAPSALVEPRESGQVSIGLGYVRILCLCRAYGL